MSPHDDQPRLQRALEVAEEAWTRWRKSPPGFHGDGALGPDLARLFCEAAEAYSEFVRAQTKEKLLNQDRRSADPSGHAATPDADYGVPLPKWLHRSSNQ